MNIINIFDRPFMERRVSIFGLVRDRQISSAGGVRLRYERAAKANLLKHYSLRREKLFRQGDNSIIEKIFTFSDLLVSLWNNNDCIVFTVGAKLEILCTLHGIRDVVYNIHTDSLVVIQSISEENRLLTTKLEYIRSRIDDNWEILFEGERNIDRWDFDMPNCLGMIYVKTDENLFKFFELESYKLLYTVRNRASPIKHFRFGNPGNKEMVMFNTARQIKLNENILALPLELISKRTGNAVRLQKLFFNSSRETCQEFVNNVKVCGDKVVVFFQRCKVSSVEMLSGINTLIVERSDNTLNRSIAMVDTNPHNQHVVYCHVGHIRDSLLTTDFYLHKNRTLILPLEYYERYTSKNSIGFWDLENSIAASGRINPVKVLNIEMEIQIPGRIFYPHNWATDREDILFAHLYQNNPPGQFQNEVTSLSFSSINNGAAINEYAIQFRTREYKTCFFYDEITGSIFIVYSHGKLCRLSPCWPEEQHASFCVQTYQD